MLQQQFVGFFGTVFPTLICWGVGGLLSFLVASESISSVSPEFALGIGLLGSIFFAIFLIKTHPNPRKKRIMLWVFSQLLIPLLPLALTLAIPRLFPRLTSNAGNRFIDFSTVATGSEAFFYVAIMAAGAWAVLYEAEKIPSPPKDIPSPLMITVVTAALVTIALAGIVMAGEKLQVYNEPSKDRALIMLALLTLVIPINVGSFAVSIK